MTTAHGLNRDMTMCSRREREAPLQNPMADYIISDKKVRPEVFVAYLAEAVIPMTRLLLIEEGVSGRKLLLRGHDCATTSQLQTFNYDCLRKRTLEPQDRFVLNVINVEIRIKNASQGSSLIDIRQREIHIYVVVVGTA